MIASIVSAAAFAALGAAESVAWSGFDRWSYNSYSELGTKQADYYPEFFKNNVSQNARHGDTSSCASINGTMSHWKTLPHCGNNTAMVI